MRIDTRLITKILLNEIRLLPTGLLFLAIVWIACPIAVSAQQSATATLRGTVVDPNGAVIPGARVTATRTNVGTSRETTTNDSGLYVFSSLVPGSYEVRIHANA